MNEPWFQEAEKSKLTDNITVTKSIHPMYLEWLRIRHMMTIHQNTPLVGKYHYLYFSKKGEISLIEMPNYLMDGIDWWEAMALKGPEELSHDEQRFRSKEEAEVWIKEVLD